MYVQAVKLTRRPSPGGREGERASSEATPPARPEQGRGRREPGAVAAAGVRGGGIARRPTAKSGGLTARRGPRDLGGRAFRDERRGEPGELDRLRVREHHRLKGLGDRRAQRSRVGVVFRVDGRKQTKVDPRALALRDRRHHGRFRPEGEGGGAAGEGDRPAQERGRGGAGDVEGDEEGVARLEQAQGAIRGPIAEDDSRASQALLRCVGAQVELRQPLVTGRHRLPVMRVRDGIVLESVPQEDRRHGPVSADVPGDEEAAAISAAVRGPGSRGPGAGSARAARGARRARRASTSRSASAQPARPPQRRAGCAGAGPP